MRIATFGLKIEDFVAIAAYMRSHMSYCKVQQCMHQAETNVVNRHSQHAEFLNDSMLKIVVHRTVSDLYPHQV